jgi:hypothetical protein
MSRSAGKPLSGISGRKTDYWVASISLPLLGDWDWERWRRLGLGEWWKCPYPLGSKSTRDNNREGGTHWKYRVVRSVSQLILHLIILILHLSCSPSSTFPPRQDHDLPLTFIIELISSGYLALAAWLTDSQLIPKSWSTWTSSSPWRAPFPNSACKFLEKVGEGEKGWNFMWRTN